MRFGMLKGEEGLEMSRAGAPSSVEAAGRREEDEDGGADLGGPSRK